MIHAASHPLLRRAPSHGHPRPTARRPVPLLQRLALWVAVARQRRALARLDAHALSDIGLTSDRAQTESRRPFWQIPDN